MAGPLSLRRATSSDVPAMGLIGTRAFRDTLSTVIFPASLRTSANEDAETTWRTARTLRRMNEGKDTFVVVDTDSNTGEETVVGFTQWERPGMAATKGQEGQHDEDKITEGMDREALAKMMGLMEEDAKKHLGPEGHANMWYLIILGVDPNHQRRGIGKRLVRWGLEQAAAEGQQVFLIATPEGRPLYESLGFQVLGEFETLGLVHYSMLWTPGVVN
ncbi:acyl-CoA N-acyltransferase [Cercophora newfieldiana]|uniref:Acyl-CoA N-acyltransferase n=1 Tax=Cercophora newfieldiana TaxID=92897 RepID=A0AA40CZG9_9PEZI|nr:acyl-CoA N-acyltransferase [Cercophora newfieldiana]